MQLLKAYCIPPRSCHVNSNGNILRVPLKVCLPCSRRKTLSGMKHACRNICLAKCHFSNPMHVFIICERHEFFFQAAAWMIYCALH
jgi:hypothetical protein